MVRFAHHNNYTNPTNKTQPSYTQNHPSLLPNSAPPLISNIWIFPDIPPLNYFLMDVTDWQHCIVLRVGYYYSYISDLKIIRVYREYLNSDSHVNRIGHCCQPTITSTERDTGIFSINSDTGDQIDDSIECRYIRSKRARVFFMSKWCFSKLPMAIFYSWCWNGNEGTSSPVQEVTYVWCSTESISGNSVSGSNNHTIIGGVHKQRCRRESSPIWNISMKRNW